MAKFKTRARAIDMLGRQQIAGIPTAINELFKNAHDAYADKVEVDYFRQDDLFLLRDDGWGMTEDEFLDRWLVLGTENKLDDFRSTPQPIPKGKEERPILGEKGIGRLAISAIGDQVLILSRARRKGELCDVIAAFIHWGLFKIPGLDLDQVIIPMRTINNYIQSDNDISNMKNELIESIKLLNKNNHVIEKEANGLIKDIERFHFSMQDYIKRCPTGLSLESNEGTHFYISSVNPSLDDDIDSNYYDKDTPSNLEKFLIGFTNTMTPNHPKPHINTAFRDHKGGLDEYDEIIDPESFFTPEDFLDADHHFTGTFDEFGQFQGKVTIYNEHEIIHKISWAGSNFKKTKCGPFSIECSYLQGFQKQSMLDPIRHAAIKRKTDRFGGLYIYKDGIRILPYGNNDYDFIDIERNRTKSASYYFFSYRRMIGVINISRKENENLIEKSGREGFIENKAYKQMQDILKNFFVQLAADFFRETIKGGSGVYNEYWEQIRAERERINKAIETRKKRATEKKEDFTKSLLEFFERTQQNYWANQLENLLIITEKELSVLGTLDNPDKAAQRLIDEESRARKELESVRECTQLKRPRGFSPNREQREDWEAYLEQKERIEATHFQPYEKKLTELVSKYRKEFDIAVNNRKRIQNAVEQVAMDAKLIAQEKKVNTQKVTLDMGKRIRALTQDLMERIEKAVQNAEAEFPSLFASDISDEDILAEISRLEQPIIREKEFATTTLEAIITQIEGIYWERDGDGNIITNQNIADSLEEEIGDLRDKVEADSELIQLGLAVNIVHHEFANSVKALRAGLRTLKKEAEVNEKLRITYQNLQTNFSHLDQYLSLLTPFNRRMYRKKEQIKAEEIYIFILDVFRGRLERHNIEIRRTKNFAATKVLGYRSVLYPTFTNLVDNAIHWLNQNKNNNKKIIRFHADKNKAFFISNNGPQIPIQDQERIFELGFSRKPNGRGMGLTISREVLKSAGYKLIVDTPDEGMNVTFKIEPIPQED